MTQNTEFNYENTYKIFPYIQDVPKELQSDNYRFTHYFETLYCDFESKCFEMQKIYEKDLISYKKFFGLLMNLPKEDIAFKKAQIKIAQRTYRGLGNKHIELRDRILITYIGIRIFDAGAIFTHHGVALNKNWEKYFLVINK